MGKVEELFKREGEKGVVLFRESLETNERNATRATTNSIASFVESTDKKVVLEIRAVGHGSIQNLETGMNAEQVRASRPDFADIEEWAIAKGFGGDSAGDILAGILNDGWNTILRNRTAPNGGTKGILSDPRSIIMQSIKNQVGAALKEDLSKRLQDRKK